MTTLRMVTKVAQTSLHRNPPCLLTFQSRRQVLLVLPFRLELLLLPFRLELLLLPFRLEFLFLPFRLEWNFVSQRMLSGCRGILV